MACLAESCARERSEVMIESVYNAIRINRKWMARIRNAEVRDGHLCKGDAEMEVAIKLVFDECQRQHVQPYGDELYCTAFALYMEA